MKFDQTPLKYTPVTSRTLLRKGSNHLAIKRASYKQAITTTSVVTRKYKFLPMQLVYRDKTEKCYPRLKFPDSLLVIANPKQPRP